MTGGINDVHPVRDARESLEQAFLRLLRPKTGHRRRGDRDATLALLLHPIRHRIAVIHITNLVDQTRVKQDPLGRRRLAGVNVRGDPDVARALHRVRTVRRIDRFIFFDYCLHLISGD